MLNVYSNNKKQAKPLLKFSSLPPTCCWLYRPVKYFNKIRWQERLSHLSHQLRLATFEHILYTFHKTSNLIQFKILARFGIFCCFKFLTTPETFLLQHNLSVLSRLEHLCEIFISLDEPSDQRASIKIVTRLRKNVQVQFITRFQRFLRDSKEMCSVQVHCKNHNLSPDFSDGNFWTFSLLFCWK